MYTRSALRKYAWLGSMSLVVACSGSDGEDNDPNESVPTSRVSTIDEGGGVFATQVNATDGEDWVYMSLATRDEVDPGPNGKDSSAWDLAFRRSNIKVNGGFSGSGSVEVAVIATDDFASVTTAPVTIYETDKLDPEVDPGQVDIVDNDSTEFVFRQENLASSNGWFSYDPINHVLAAAEVVYIVRANSGTYYKLRFLDYYDQAGTAGYPTIRYAEIGAPNPAAEGFELDASDAETPVYLDLETGSKVSVSDPATSTDWDLMVRRTSFATNSGASGSGLGGAKWAPNADFIGAKLASTIGYVADTTIAPPGPPVPEDQWIAGNRVLDEWFDYDSATQTVTPKNGFFVIRSADGTGYYKLKIFVYEDGVYRIDIGPLQRDIDTQTLTVTSSNAASWRYVNLRTGDIQAETASTTTDWDVAFSGTRVRTNSGTSGPGSAGAVELVGERLIDVLEAPAETYSADAIIAAEAGQDDYSGNPVLGAWFDFDSVNNVVSVRETSYVLRLADGTFAKMQFVAFEDDTYTLRYAYAGPVGTSF